MSRLVLLGEQPSAVELAIYADRLQRIQEADSTLVPLAKEGKLAALLEKSITASVITSTPSDDDVTALFALGFAVLAQITSGAEAANATKQFATILTAEPATRAALKIRLLTNLINVVGALTTVTPAQRFGLLVQLFDFAVAATKASPNTQPTPASLVLQPLTSLSSTIDFWKLSPVEALELYAASYRLSTVVGPAGAKRELTADGTPIVYNLGAQPLPQHEYLYAYLKAVDGASAVNPALLKDKTLVDAATEGVLASISNGLSENIHILDSTNLYPLAIVQSLSSSNSAIASSAFALLKILVDGDLKGWTAFEKSHAAFLKDQAKLFDSTTLLRKLRTIALCQLSVANQSAVGAADNVLTYAQIRTGLGLPANEEVESLVIDAVLAGRLDAKMDQEHETLCIKRITGGVPISLYSGPNAAAAWSALGGRLRTWKQNLSTVLTTLNLSQQVPQEDAEDIQ